MRLQSKETLTGHMSDESSIYYLNKLVHVSHLIDQRLIVQTSIHLKGYLATDERRSHEQNQNPGRDLCIGTMGRRNVHTLMLKLAHGGLHYQE